MKRTNQITALVVFGTLLGMSIFVSMPAVAEIEVDYFPNSEAELEIITPTGFEIISVSGPTTVDVNLSALGDSDGDGLEQVPTEIVQMELTGSSPSFGPINITLSPHQRSVGEIEEESNNNSGVLDIPPFAPSGTAESFFDVFFEIEIMGMTLLNLDPLNLSGRITHKPPAEGESLCSLDQIRLFNEYGVPSDFFVGATCHTPNPVAEDIEVDYFPNSEAVVEIETPWGSREIVTLQGPTTVEVILSSLNDNDGNGQEQVQTEIVAMELTGSSPSFGNVTIRLRDPLKSPFQRSTGEIEENANNNPGVLDIPPFTPSGTADSFFDVFFEIEMGGYTLHNRDPARIEAENLTHKPPAENETYCGEVGVILYDEDNNPSGVVIRSACHTPNPGDGDGDGGLPCPFTQGFWKNHPEVWPVNTLNLGSQNYTQSELIDILKTPVRGDASLILAHQLIPAKLNVANGSDSANISAAITEADGLLSSFSGKLPQGVRPSIDMGHNMTSVAEELDSYNNRALTPYCVDYEPDKEKDKDQEDQSDSSNPAGLIALVAVAAALVASTVWILGSRRRK